MAGLYRCCVGNAVPVWVNKRVRGGGGGSLPTLGPRKLQGCPAGAQKAPCHAILPQPLGNNDLEHVLFSLLQQWPRSLSCFLAFFFFSLLLLVPIPPRVSLTLLHMVISIIFSVSFSYFAFGPVPPPSLYVMTLFLFCFPRGFSSLICGYCFNGSLVPYLFIPIDSAVLLCLLSIFYSPVAWFPSLSLLSFPLSFVCGPPSCHIHTDPPPQVVSDPLGTFRQPLALA